MTSIVKVSSITISSDRQRREFDPEALTDLANSISRNGLLHAIVVRETAEGLSLVAGERRLRALETIWIVGDGLRYNGVTLAPYEVPVSTLGELSELEAEEAELDENFRRQDLTWQEHSAALARLHRLRQAQAEDAASHSMRDTWKQAREEGLITADYGTTRAAILLADHLDNPVIAKAKTEQEALKILTREEEKEKNIARAITVGKDYTSAVHKLYNVDCIKWLSTCPDNEFDVILGDPPYGMGADNFGDGAGKLTNNEHNYDDSPEAWNALMQKLMPHLFRVAKPQAHAYLFCDFEKFPDLKVFMKEAGWYVFRTPLIDYKLGSGRVPLPEHGPRRQYECILYAIKGNKPVTGIYSDVIPCKLEENLAHGANKPVELFVDLLKRSCRPGDKVLDPFAGTGTIFPAAHACKLYATGLEIKPHYYGIAIERLNRLDDQLEMV